ncbi:MAG: hypothetical protein PHY08_00185 [Candidatus Cloacimonetes bacterium]|jgi:hypothetical protein|nr:hypothetical protein [Candidatus Cloacimonadota bacterium]MDD4154975.1 hypothetical protein [Candidatus Cloacimonadota bacterium]
MIKKVLLIVFIVSLFNFLSADYIEDKLSQMLEENANGYLQPLANTMGAGLNSGYFNTAKVLKTLRPSVMIGAAFIPIPSNEKKFNAITPTSTVETSTIFGNNGNNGFPEGTDLNIAAVPTVSFSLGLPKGNEIMLRGFPPIKITDDIGNISLWGVGFKHSIDQYLTKLFPIDWSIQAVYQQLTVGDIVDVNTLAFNMQASKKLLFLTPYCALGYEKAQLKAKYTYDDGLIQEEIKLKLDAENDIKATVGLRYSILILDIFADYSLANTSTFNIGVGASF